MCSDDFLSLNEADLSFTRRIHKLYEKLEGDEYGAAFLRKDVYALFCRSGNVIGLINLTNKPCFLTEYTNRFTGGTWLVDHRLYLERKDSLCFAPRSVSIYKKT